MGPGFHDPWTDFRGEGHIHQVRLNLDCLLVFPTRIEYPALPLGGSPESVVPLGKLGVNLRRNSEFNDRLVTVALGQVLMPSRKMLLLFDLGILAALSSAKPTQPSRATADKSIRRCASATSFLLTVQFLHDSEPLARHYRNP